MIRTADVDLDGRLKVTAGATLVRDSDPAYEVAETHAKAGGILSAFGLVPAAPAPRHERRRAGQRRGRAARAQRPQPAAEPVLAHRPGRLAAGPARCRGKQVVILDGEDDFVNMLRHVLGVHGHDQRRSSATRSYDARRARRLRPGDRRAGARRPARRRRPQDGDLPGGRRRLLERRQPFLAVCLGHQVLCHRLGIPLAFKDIVFQGTQSPVDIGGRTERVGFYNTFVGRVGRRALPEGVAVEADPATGDVHLVRGPALPRHPVPRRVDPHRARLRPAPRPGRATFCFGSAGQPSCRSRG